MERIMHAGVPGVIGRKPAWLDSLVTVRSKPWRRHSVWPKMLSLMLMGSAHSAHAVEFSPQDCKVKDPDGLTYIALGTTVLRLPITRLNITHAPVANVPQPAAPDPEEPLGCPNNPFRQQSLIFSFGFDAWLKDRSKPSGSLLKEMRLIASKVDYWGIRNEEFHPGYCKQFPRRIKLDNGLVGCLPPENPKRLDRGESGSYLADRKTYSAPFEKEFAIICRPSIPTGTECNVSYKILPTVNLAYSFSTTKISLDDAIDFDRGVRDSIQRAAVPDYKWNY